MGIVDSVKKYHAKVTATHKAKYAEMKKQNTEAKERGRDKSLDTPTKRKPEMKAGATK